MHGCKTLIGNHGSPDIAFHTCPRARTDGLAMSSRNARLNETERKKAISYLRNTSCT